MTITDHPPAPSPAIGADIDVRLLSGSIGAEIEGIDVRHLDDNCT